ncbi:MAG TPA: bifunctional glutamate N-acetyltransferase/amino-acid acetyltransferase ArgJ [Fredinandcohnia sp.]|nr:bifunctional glutamate N-acetyltransferase/amino-acid acetyltransferase ArgJ [Fredinandcohnia sp.]
MNLPLGFSFAGVHAGIKPFKKDLALVVSETPAAAAGCFTPNRARAAPVRDTAARLPGRMRAVVVHSGNANALTGAQGDRDARAVVEATARALGCAPEEVVSAGTGVIGVPLPVPLVEAALPALVQALGPDPLPAAEAILTTDTRTKTAGRELRLGDRTVRLFAICKGAGMIAPQLATMIAVIATDAAIAPALLDRALRRAMTRSFNALTVDGDMSTNDAVIALANGAAKNPPIEEEGEDFAAFAAALELLCQDLARQIARDGEGATKLVEVEVRGAPSETIALELARAIAGSSLVKAALFGCDPAWGRILATVGARAATLGVDLEPAAATVRIQGREVYRQGLVPFDREAVRARLREPTCTVEVELGQGEGAATAWGCDLGYDYVRINADLASFLEQGPNGGLVKDERLDRHTPGFKVSLLLQALSYIRRFAGSRCVVYLGASALRQGPPLAVIANDLLLLRSVGLAPIIVHGLPNESLPDEGFIEVHRALVALLNQEEGGAVGITGEDGALFRVRGGGPGFEVNHAFLGMLVNQGYIPVIAPIGIGDDGRSRVLDADRVAAEVALSVGARKLVFLSNVPGILDGETLLPELSPAHLDALVAEGKVFGGMLRKLDAIRRALSGGVRQAHVIDGRPPHGIISELFTDRGVGTLIREETDA